MILISGTLMAEPEIRRRKRNIRKVRENKMQYCPKCRVNIHGMKTACPLCQKKLDLKEPDQGSFPVFPKKKISSVTVMKILTFILAAFWILTWMLEFMIPDSSPVIRICQISAFFIWLDIFVINYYKYNILKTITLESYIVIVTVLITDILTGWHRWSITWVVPSMLFALMIATLIVSKAAGLHADEFIAYFYKAVHELVSLSGGGHGDALSPAGCGSGHFRFRGFKDGRGQEAEPVIPLKNSTDIWSQKSFRT